MVLDGVRQVPACSVHSQRLGPPSRALGGALIKAREPVLLSFNCWKIDGYFDVFNI